MADYYKDVDPALTSVWVFTAQDSSSYYYYLIINVFNHISRLTFFTGYVLLKTTSADWKTNHKKAFCKFIYMTDKISNFAEDFSIVEMQFRNFYPDMDLTQQSEMATSSSTSSKTSISTATQNRKNEEQNMGLYKFYMWINFFPVFYHFWLQDCHLCFPLPTLETSSWRLKCSRTSCQSHYLTLLQGILKKDQDLNTQYFSGVYLHKQAKRARGVKKITAVNLMHGSAHKVKGISRGKMSSVCPSVTSNSSLSLEARVHLLLINVKKVANQIFKIFA